MFGMPWEIQPCSKLRKNHARFGPLNENANDTRAENIGKISSGGTRGRVTGQA